MADLAAMHLQAEHVGPVDQLLVGFGIVGLYALDQFELAQRAARGGAPV